MIGFGKRFKLPITEPKFREFLCFVCRNGFMRTLSLLIELGVCLEIIGRDEREDAEDTQSFSILNAIKHDQIHVLNLYLEMSVDLDGVWANLVDSVVHNVQSKCLPVLLSIGASVDGLEYCVTTALRKAASYGNFEQAQMLIDRLENINTGVEVCGYPLDGALIDKPFASKMADFSLRNGAKADGLSLYRACDADLFDIVIQILRLPSVLNNINYKRIDYTTPLHAACMIGNVEMVAYLIRYGADVNAVDNFRETPLDKAKFK